MMEILCDGNVQSWRVLCEGVQCCTMECCAMEILCDGNTVVQCCAMECCMMEIVCDGVLCCAVLERVV